VGEFPRSKEDKHKSERSKSKRPMNKEYIERFAMEREARDRDRDFQGGEDTSKRETEIHQQYLSQKWTGKRR
jgi:hypothetical protein